MYWREAREPLLQVDITMEKSSSLQITHLNLQESGIYKTWPQTSIINLGMYSDWY